MEFMLKVGESTIQCIFVTWIVSLRQTSLVLTLSLKLGFTKEDA